MRRVRQTVGRVFDSSIAATPCPTRSCSGANRLGESVRVFSLTNWWPVMSKRKGLEGMFDGPHFDREIIFLCVLWYLRHKLSLRDLVFW
jgi:hypothetical protein